MLNQLRPAIVLTLLLALLTGAAYPLAITGIAQLAFPSQSNGSLVYEGQTVIGSSLIGQDFTAPRYFHGRPSATTPAYNAASSGGSNLGPTSAALLKRVGAAVRTLGLKGPAPADAVTASASGLDPDISPANAIAQAARVAGARGQTEARLDQLIDAMTQRPLFGIFGEPRVNVLALNLALDRLPAPQEPHAESQ